jgi:DNA-binding IscR family transcriptional regulator
MTVTQKADWTFLSNHAHVLIYVSKFKEARIRDVAEAVGITERFAQKILKDLVEAGYLTAIRQGRRKTYELVEGLKFRHPLEQGAEISKLINIFAAR